MYRAPGYPGQRGVCAICGGTDHRGRGRKGSDHSKKSRVKEYWEISKRAFKTGEKPDLDALFCNDDRLCAKMRLNTFSRIGFEEAEHLCI